MSLNQNSGYCDGYYSDYIRTAPVPTGSILAFTFTATYFCLGLSNQEERQFQKCFVF